MPALVFLSASATDHEWLDELRHHLVPYQSRGIVPWDKRDIPAGKRVNEASEEALGRAELAVLLVSSAYLADTFIDENELYQRLSGAVARGLRVAWIPVSASAYQETDICDYSPLHDPREPLDGLDRAAQARALVSICEKIAVSLDPNAPPRDPVVPPELLAYEPLQPGDVLGEHDEYFLVRELAVSAATTVWLATERASGGTKVAIKVLDRRLAPEPTKRERFLRGARTATRLRHTAIVGIFDTSDEEHGQPFFVMEYVEGVSLRDSLRDRRVTPEQAIRLALRLGEALEYAHALGIVHGDVQPANVLLSADGSPHLLGFDLAYPLDDDAPRAPRTGVHVAPELQDPARSFDARVDVYGLARTVLVMLGDDGRSALAARHGEALSQLLLRAAAVAPEERPASVDEFCRLLSAAWDTAPAEAAPHPVAAPGRPATSPVLVVPPPLARASAPWWRVGGALALVGAVALAFALGPTPWLPAGDETDDKKPEDGSGTGSASSAGEREDGSGEGSAPSTSGSKETEGPDRTESTISLPATTVGDTAKWVEDTKTDTGASVGGSTPPPSDKTRKRPRRSDKEAPPPTPPPADTAEDESKAGEVQPAQPVTVPAEPLRVQLDGFKSKVLSTCGSEVKVLSKTVVAATLTLGQDPAALERITVQSFNPALKKCVERLLKAHKFAPCSADCGVELYEFTFGGS